ncbi:MAG: CAP domain-containing protein [Sulfitobacter sp.]
MSEASEFETLMLSLINEERANANLDPLTFNGVLNDSAEDHSDWMLETDQFSHTGENGSSVQDRTTAAGYELEGNWAIGENIGWQSERGEPGIADDVRQIHESLMNSPGHRANILSANYDEIGIGIEQGDFEGFDGVMITQNFGATDAVTEEPVPPVDPVVPAPETPVAEGPDPVEPTPETPVAEGPDPVEPAPETPVAEGPDPVEPAPETPVAEGPDPVEPTPETPVAEGPDPVVPAPETPVAEGPDPVEPAPETPVAEGLDPVEPAPETPVAEGPDPVEPAPETPVAEGPQEAFDVDAFLAQLSELLEDMFESLGFQTAGDTVDNGVVEFEMAEDTAPALPETDMNDGTGLDFADDSCGLNYSNNVSFDLNFF